MNIRRALPLIHVIDDDEAVSSSLVLLGEARGWKVETYSRADHYLAGLPFAERPPDCLVVDLQMPGMNGAELLEALQATGRHIAAIVLTAWPESELARRAREAGAREVLSKPFAPGAWLSAVEASLFSA